MKYRFFEKSIIAVVNSFRQEFRNFAYVANDAQWQEFPVYIQNSGDKAYMTVHSDRIEGKKKTDRVMLPCMVLHYRGVTINEDNKTHEISDGKATIELNGFPHEIVGEMSMYDCTLRMEATLLFSDIFQQLAFAEYVMNGVYKQKPFKFSYMKKVQVAAWQMETVDHDAEYDEVGLFGDAEVASHQEIVSFNVHLQYPSFNLNSRLKGSVDGDGDGNNEGGVDASDGTLQSASNVIKGVASYVDEGKVSNTVSKDIKGEFPIDKQKKLTHE